VAGESDGGHEASPLDPDEQRRLHAALGLGASSAEPVRRRDRQRPAEAVASPSEDVTFVLIDLERKIDKLLDSAQAVDQLTAQVRELNERIIHLERRLIGLT